MPRTKRVKRQVERLALVAETSQFTLGRPMTAAEIDTAGRRLKKALLERTLGAELSHHLGYPTA